MSKWNRPMRKYRPASMRCAVCGEPVQPGAFGDWEHVRRLRLREWHRVLLEGVTG